MLALCIAVQILIDEHNRLSLEGTPVNSSERGLDLPSSGVAQSNLVCHGFLAVGSSTIWKWLFPVTVLACPNLSAHCMLLMPMKVLVAGPPFFSGARAVSFTSWCHILQLDRAHVMQQSLIGGSCGYAWRGKEETTRSGAMTVKYRCLSS